MELAYFGMKHVIYITLYVLEGLLDGQTTPVSTSPQERSFKDTTCLQIESNTPYSRQLDFSGGWQPMYWKRPRSGAEV
jgi:hypothetical protein